jgi:tetratricopeptide (TPR) repeat protein
MREISFRVGEPYPTAGLADAMMMEGDVAGARKQYEAALQLSQDAHQDDHAAQVQTALARVALEEKRFNDGEALARGAIVTFDKDNVADNGAWARAILARNLLGEGKLPEAQTLAAQALTLAQQSVSQPQHFEATLADARAKAKAGKISEAEKELDAMLLSTRKSGYRAFEFEARLTRAEIELQSHSPEARPHLATLAKDARDHGLLLVANHAEALLQSK